MYDSFEAKRIDAYFSHVAGQFPRGKPATSVCVAHMVPNAVHFLNAVERVSSLRLVLPKPKSMGTPEFNVITCEQGRPFHPLSREWAANPTAVVETFSSFGISGQDLILVDIGGYFATSVNDIAAQYPGRVLGVMEGTENGLQKYEESDERLEKLRIPVLTVARSPLKLPEDYLVGSSVVFSVEAVLREIGQILQTRTACVVGYGKVGRAVAAVLRGRGINTVVHDTDPVAMAEAAAQGYQCYRQLSNALRHASLVIGATGQRSLDKFGFAALRTGAVVATVTSSDDELDLDALEKYESSQVSDNVTRYDEGGAKYFWLINNGNAANFLHGAVIGPAIQLIEGEKIAAISKLTHSPIPPGIAEVSRSVRAKVAEAWNEHFLTD